MAAYKSDFKSSPEGYWTWGALIVAGLAYNPKLLKPEDAPKTWKDALDPKYTGVINAKTSTSGLQHVAWYELRNLYGDEYFQKLAELKPRGFNSYVQQFDRMVSGQDTIVHTAQYSAYLLSKAKGAPVEFVFPEEGLALTPGVLGVVAEAPHPNAAQLFMDWFLSVPGQKVYDEISSLSSPRTDAPPPPGGLPIDRFKLLYPKDWQAFLATHDQFVKAWSKVTGVRWIWPDGSAMSSAWQPQGPVDEQFRPSAAAQYRRPGDAADPAAVRRAGDLPRRLHRCGIDQRRRTRRVSAG